MCLNNGNYLWRLIQYHFLLIYRNTAGIWNYFSVFISAGGVIFNGEGTDASTQDFLANKGK